MYFSLSYRGDKINFNTHGHKHTGFPGVVQASQDAVQDKLHLPDHVEATVDRQEREEENPNCEHVALYLKHKQVILHTCAPTCVHATKNVETQKINTFLLTIITEFVQCI